MKQANIVSSMCKHLKSSQKEYIQSKSKMKSLQTVYNFKNVPYWRKCKKNLMVESYMQELNFCEFV
jgi:hypothetical protein